MILLLLGLGVNKVFLPWQRVLLASPQAASSFFGAEIKTKLQ